MAGELTENWRPIVGYEDQYQVSDQGRVRSLARHRIGAHGSRTRVSERILKPGGNRYPMVLLCKDGNRRGFSIHRLVAEAFIPAVGDRQEVNHRDGNPTNNVASNLEWVNRSENVAHSYRTVGRHGWKKAVR